MPPGESRDPARPVTDLLKQDLSLLTPFLVALERGRVKSTSNRPLSPDPIEELTGMHV